MVFCALVNVTDAVMFDANVMFVKTTTSDGAFGKVSSPALAVKHKARATRKRVTFFISISPCFNPLKAELNCAVDRAVVRRRRRLTFELGANVTDFAGGQLDGDGAGREQTIRSRASRKQWGCENGAVGKRHVIAGHLQDGIDVGAVRRAIAGGSSTNPNLNIDDFRNRIRSRLLQINRIGVGNSGGIRIQRNDLHEVVVNDCPLVGRVVVRRE
jgi:hypothetical protein